MPHFVTTMGFKVFSDDLNQIPISNPTAKTINTISPNSYGISRKDAIFDQALKDTDYLVLDGVYFAFASIFLQGKNIQKNQGPEVFYHFMKRLKEMKGRAFFLGSSNETLSKIEERIRKEYPEIQCETYSPPFKPAFTEEDNNAMITAINNFKADVLFVGMTCPKQEKWSVQHQKQLQTGLIISIGNVFDWFAGTQKTIHPFWFKLRLGWLVRIFLRPEIFRRNIGNQMKFFADVLMTPFKKVKNAAP